jgi:NitT/TauT family transport system permease protein
MCESGRSIAKMKVMKKLFTASTVLYLLLLILFLYPFGAGRTYALLAVGATVIKAIQLALRYFTKDEEKKKSTDDILAVFFLVIFLWQLLSAARLGIISGLLFPEPDEVMGMFFSELPDMCAGLINSLILLVSGYLLAMVTAIPLGILVGWHGRLYRLAGPYAKVLGPIPPIVYIPYAISLLPSFRSASICVIFIGAFWPTFINTIHGVLNIPGRLIDASRVLTIRKRTLMLRVILPGAMPSICVGAELSLLFSFLMLTAAELIGANSGVGWYVRNFGDFGDYPRVLSGLIFIGIVITVITWGTGKLERWLLRWTDVKKH